MLNVSEIASSTEERVLTGVKVSQTLVLDTFKNGIALADRVMPAPVADRIEERVAVLPSATPLINGAFDFAGKLLAAQRDFAGEMIEILQPAPAKKAAPNAAAKKAPTKKAAAKRTTKKAA